MSCRPARTHLAIRTMIRRAICIAICAISILALVQVISWPIGAAEPAAFSAAADSARERAKLFGRLGVDRWHAAGFRGQGVKILVLDSGFRGWKSHLGQALPKLVLSQSFRESGGLEARDSQHGILCAEVIHTIAPDAEILFANWEPDRAESFVQAIEWGHQNGARLMSCSVIMPCWSDGEGGGPIHAALKQAMGDGASKNDMLGFACAGNIAQRHWHGAFRRGSDGCHEWMPGQTLNSITPWGDERVSVELCHPAGEGFVVQVLDRATGAEVGRAQAPPGGTSAVVRFQPQPNIQYAVRAWPATTGEAGKFHVAVLGAWLERFSERGSIPFPADGSEFVAVGAIDNSNRRMSYSSCGPNGKRPKPDFVAEVPVWSAARPAPFSGTSAAAPQACGLAAVLLSRHPNWTPSQICTALQKAAEDIAPPGHDPETGYGRLRLPAD